MENYCSWKTINKSIFFLFIIIFGTTVTAEIVSEISVSGGYTDNLFFDSTRFHDSYSSISPFIKYYPSSKVEMSVAGTYTGYSKTDDLGNLSGQAGISFMPLNENLPYTLVLSGDIYNRIYGHSFDVYNNYGYKATAVGVYKLGPSFHIRSGGAFYSTTYNNATSGDYNGFEIYTGINFTLPGNNSINLETGYNNRDYQNYTSGNLNGSGNQDFDIESNFQAVYLSARLSRQLGAKTGLSVNYVESSFIEKNDPIVYGFSLDYLTPWASLWDGRSLTVKIKNFSIKNVILETGIQYTKKYFVPMLEQAVIEDEYILSDRNDTRNNLFLYIQRPFKTEKGKLIKPSIMLEYIDNSSNLALYDYSYLNISAAINIRF